MGLSNYHCHTFYSDGKSKPLDFIEKALELRMTSIGFSEHAPLPFETSWNMKSAKVDAYISEIHELKGKYADKIEIYCGMEIDHFPVYQNQIFETSKKKLLDFSIGSLHFLGFKANGEPWNTDSSIGEFEIGAREIFGNNGKKLVEKYYSETIAMIENMQPSIIGHFDKIKMFNSRNRFFDEESTYCKNAVLETLQCVKKQNTIIEFNTRGLYKHNSGLPYPSPWILKEMKRIDIPVTVNSDSHHADEIILKFPEALQILKDAGYTSQCQLRKGKWVEVGIND
jgi:histidinol-phosphatase (PHP family)